ncbi:hypothetical protein [Streptomyces sp. NRRL F-5755]|nr:hypothetical protein [Streptomyces sp. NRRL F-5755]
MARPWGMPEGGAVVSAVKFGSQDALEMAFAERERKLRRLRCLQSS